LDRDRFDGLPLAKPMRVIDDTVLDRFRGPGRCEWCKRDCIRRPHHVRTRGAGGGDVERNIVGICDPCHDNTHRGLEPTREQLEQLIERRERMRLTKLTPEEEKAWEHAFCYWANEAATDEKADQEAWKEMQKQFPRLNDFDGAEP
jgi:hypothetical protein